MALLQCVLASLVAAGMTVQPTSEFVVAPVRRQRAEDAPPANSQECDGHDRSTAIANYLKGEAQIFFYHITHHAGTRIRDLMRTNKRIVHFPIEEQLMPRDNMSKEIPCHSNKWVSVIAMRDPMTRMFSIDGNWGPPTADANLDRCSTDNYGLRMVAGVPFGQKLTWEDVDKAKQRLEKFDFVLDVGNFENSLRAMCFELGWEDCKPPPAYEHVRSVHKTANGTAAFSKPPDASEPDKPDWYKRLQTRNRFETELYKHAQHLSKNMLNRLKPEHASVKQTGASDGWAQSEHELSEESHLKWTCGSTKAVDS